MYIPVWLIVIGLIVIIFSAMAQASMRNDLREMIFEQNHIQNDRNQTIIEKLSDLNFFIGELTTEHKENFEKLISDQKRGDKVYNFNTSLLVGLITQVMRDGREAIERLDDIAHSQRFDTEMLEALIKHLHEDTNIGLNYSAISEELVEGFEGRSFSHKMDNKRYQETAEEDTGEYLEAIRAVVAEAEHEKEEKSNG